MIVRINFHFSRVHNLSDSVKFNVASKCNMSNSSFEKKMIKWKNHIHKCHDQVCARKKKALPKARNWMKMPEIDKYEFVEKLVY